MTSDVGVSSIDHVRQLERLITGLVHDLNNPLAGIIGYAQLARTEPDVERRTRFLDSIKQQADSLKESLADLLHIAITNAPPNDVVSASEIVGLAQLRLRARLDAAGVHLETDVPKRPLATRGDGDVLTRALTKLVDNAIQAVRATAAPVVRVAASAVDGWLRLEVSDNGPGFDPAMAARAFDPTATSRRSGNGVGLGLPMAMAAAQRHGGRVEIATAAEVAAAEPSLGGALVRLVLPLA